MVATFPKNMGGARFFFLGKNFFFRPALFAINSVTHQTMMVLRANTTAYTTAVAVHSH
ncbi:hypothetical protein [Frog virus 3]|uniref:Uncharacterized protein n=1 Tax=Frog virus 3 TaxID=10493 RepID=A0A3G2Y333_FRG3V|nr:hypothetical protein [Frog virus 3]